MRLSLRVVVAGVALVAAVHPVFAAPGPSGAAVGTVSGYRVSDVAYVLDWATPDRLAAISFALDPGAARDVRVQLGESWSRCVTHRGRARCDFSQPLPRVSDLRALVVLATG